MDPRYPPKPVIVITGGNGGVGLGIALRLLSELSSPSQPDIRPISASSEASESSLVSPFATPNGATLVLATRNVAKAEAARRLLYKSVGKVVGGDEIGVTVGAMVNGDGELSSSDDDEDEKISRRLLPRGELSAREYRRRWLQNLDIDLVELDLASISSTFACADAVKKRYPYVTHLLLNAGGGPFVSLNWPLAVYSILTNFLPSVTYPPYLIEESGWTTSDHLGWTWQTNLFSHYLLARALLPSLAAFSQPSPSACPRIVWTTSLEAQPYFCDDEDLQASKPNPRSKNGCSYVSVKYQMGLAGWGFNRVIADYEREHGGGPVAFSIVCQPGITAGLMFLQIIGAVMDFFMKLAFYFARLIGSPHHIVSPYKAALCWTYVCLAPLSTVLSSSLTPRGPVRFGSKVTRSGKEYVGVEAYDASAPDDPRDVYGRKRWFDEARADKVMGHLDEMREKVLRARGQVDAI